MQEIKVFRNICNQRVIIFFRKLYAKECKLMNRCVINILEDSYLLMINMKRYVNMNIFRTKSYYYSFYYSFCMQKGSIKINILISTNIDSTSFCMQVCISFYYIFHSYLLHVKRVIKRVIVIFSSKNIYIYVSFCINH